MYIKAKYLFPLKDFTLIAYEFLFSYYIHPQGLNVHPRSFISIDVKVWLNKITMPMVPIVKPH